MLLLCVSSCQAQGLPKLEIAQPVIEDRTPQDPGSGFLKVKVPEIPSSMTLFGEQVPLDNYDTRESLEKELTTIIYNHGRTIQILINYNRYYAIIKPIMEAAGIPDDFKYLCIAESSFDPNAVSTASAAGLWQFMSSVAKQYGLIVGSDVDQRYDMYKETQAACRLLNDYKKQMGSWTLAAAAYNLGPAGVRTRITKQGTTDYYDSFLPTETARYIFRIMAYKILIENPQLYGYEEVLKVQHPLYDGFREVEISSATIDWSKVAQENGTNYKILREWNPWIRNYTYNNASRTTFTLRIPSPEYRKSAKETRQ